MAQGDGSGSRISAGMVVMALAVVALVAFVFQNTEDAQFNWMVVEVTMPLWLALVIAAGLGAVIAELGGWLMRRRKS